MKPEEILELIKDEVSDDYYKGSLYIIELEDGSSFRIQHTLISMIEDNIKYFLEEYGGYLKRDEDVILIEFINSDLEIETHLKVINVDDIKFVQEDVETGSYLQVDKDLNTSIKNFVRWYI